MRVGLRVTAVLLAPLLASCSPASDLPAGTAAEVIVIAGDAQVGAPLTDLATPVALRVVDSHGDALANTSIDIAVLLGAGSVPSPTIRTDDNGEASTLWRMGADGGIEELQVTAGSAPPALVVARSCGTSECYPDDHAELPLDGAMPLQLATYEGSGQAVHPDVVAGHGALHGFWLLVTPYPSGSIDYENPSVFRSSDARAWTVPAGVTNPLARPDTSSPYLSDPDVVFNPTDQKLWVYFRGASSLANIIKLIRSSDGTTWDKPVEVLKVPAHQAVSPAIVRGAPQAPWQMWTINAGPAGCTATNTTVERRTSTDGMSWSDPVPVSLVQPGQAIWHIDVSWIPARKEYWAIYNTYAIGTACSTQSLYLARSTDAIHWSVGRTPIAQAGLISAFSDIIYRSSMMIDPSATFVTLWLSGARYDRASHEYLWSTAVAATSVARLLQLTNLGSAALHATTSVGALPNPEPDGTSGP